MSVSRGDNRRASPDVGMARIGSLLLILTRLYGYPRGTSTAHAYIERARIAPLLTSRCDAHLAAGVGITASRRKHPSPGRSHPPAIAPTSDEAFGSEFPYV